MSMTTPYFTALTPLSFLERSAAVFRAKEAVVYGERTYTYAQFRDKAERQARALRGIINPGDPVAFLASNVPELLIAHFAVPLAGGVLVAMNTRLSRSEIVHILNHSGARVLIADSELLTGIGVLMTDVDQLERVVEIVDPTSGVSRSGFATADYEEFLHSGSPESLVWSIDDENSLIAINYTSGTTGQPRGAMYTHRVTHLNSMGFALHNGYIEVKDRVKDLIISGGENVSSIEVENALLAQPEVAEAAVGGEPHPKWGERPIAWVVPHPGSHVDPDALRARLRIVIAPFKVPDRILFLDYLPRTSTGKVLKNELHTAATHAPDERTLT